MDNLSLKCSIGFCGAISYDFVTFEDTSVRMNIPAALVTISDDTAAKVLTIDASATTIASVGAFKCKIVGRMVGSTLTVESTGYFTITVINPCL